MVLRRHRELYDGEADIGYEVDIGGTPPGHPSPGRWKVRRDTGGWRVLFRSLEGAEYVIHVFSPTEEGEQAARSMGLCLVDIAWGRR